MKRFLSILLALVMVLSLVALQMLYHHFAQTHFHM